MVRGVVAARIPEFVTSFFGPQLPETALARHLIWLLTVEFILLADADAVLISLSGERAGGALLPTGIALLIGSLPLFAGSVRVAGRMPVRQLRGIKLWRALDA